MSYKDFNIITILKIVFFSKILKYSGLWPFSVPDSVPSVSVCVHTPGRYKTSAAAEQAEFRKITKF